MLLLFIIETPLIWLRLLQNLLEYYIDMQNGYSFLIKNNFIIKIKCIIKYIIFCTLYFFGRYFPESATMKK